MRWVGGLKMPIFVHVLGEKCPRQGRSVGSQKKGKIMFTYLLNEPYGLVSSQLLLSSGSTNIVKMMAAVVCCLA